MSDRKPECVEDYLVDAAKLFLPPGYDVVKITVAPAEGDARHKAGFNAGVEAAAKMLEPLTSWSGRRGHLAREVRMLKLPEDTNG